MARCGTYFGYRSGCRCTLCTTANREAKRRERNRRRGLPVETLLPPGPKPRPAFDNRMGNLKHAMTLEEWRAREAADPTCRPVTQPSMRLHPDSHNDLGDGLTPFERIIARGTQ